MLQSYRYCILYIWFIITPPPRTGNVTPGETVAYLWCGQCWALVCGGGARWDWCCFNFLLTQTGCWLRAGKGTVYGHRQEVFVTDLVFGGGGGRGGRGLRFLGGGVYVCGLQVKEKTSRQVNTLIRSDRSVITTDTMSSCLSAELLHFISSLWKLTRVKMLLLIW